MSPTLLFISILSSSPILAAIPAEIFLQDDNGVQEFEIACDQLQCFPEDRTSHLLTNLSSKTPAETATLATTRERNSENHFNLVLYPKNEVRTRENQRTLSRRIHAEMDGSTPAQKIAELIGATSFKVPHYSASTLILTFPNPGDSLDKLADLKALPGVTSARPLLSRLRVRRLIPNDPRFAWSASNTSYQWHLNNTGQNGSLVGIDANVIDVWENYLGTGVTVSVVDDGIQVSHEDLAPNINSTIDHDWNDNTPDDPTPPLSQQADGFYLSHGTSVAGVIAGRGDNNLGISGAAPRASLVGLKILADFVSAAEEAEALAWHTGIIDISNNSWGTPDDGVTHYKTDPLVVSAFESGVTNGRGGKGTIYVWSAGNGRDIADYATFDGFVNQPETIGVGSVSSQGVQSFYSESGSNVLISAPSSNDFGDPGITTTTITTEGSYTNSFGGTSSAAPLVSGVIALILEANPNLGWRDVQEVLIRSARKVDATDTGWADNAAGFHFHHGYGAGMIDAQAAVALAETWINLGEQIIHTVPSTAINQTIPDDSPTGTTHTFSADTDDMRVEHITLTIDIDHSYRGDLAITLTSPDGTTSVLAESNFDDSSDYENFPLLSVHHWGETLNGDWTLKVTDSAAQDVGTLNSTSLEFRGAAVPLGYPDWVASSFSPAEQADPSIVGELADPDDDGRSNLLEYAFNGNPSSPETSLPGEPTIVTNGNGTFLRYTADQSKFDLTYTLKRSLNLLTPWQTISTNTSSTQGTLEIRELSINPTEPKNFFRVEVMR